MEKSKSEVNLSTELSWKAPLEIEDDSQFEVAGMRDYPVRTWHVGEKPVKVVLVPSNQATYKYLIQQIRKKYLANYRLMRCQVLGKRGKLIRCPEENKCEDCPFHVNPEDRQSFLIDLSVFCVDEDGEYTGEIPFVSGSDTAGEAETAILYELLKVHLNNVDPSLVPVMELTRDGYAPKEISEKLGIPQPTVYKRLRQIREGISEVFAD